MVKIAQPAFEVIRIASRIQRPISQRSQLFGGEILGRNHLVETMAHRGRIVV